MQVTMYVTDEESHLFRHDVTLYPQLSLPRVHIHVVYKRQVSGVRLSPTRLLR